MVRKLVQLLLAVPAAAAATDYDLLVRGARVVDGTGSPWYRADLGVRDGDTTVVTGTCGSSRTDLAAFFARLESLWPGPNVASLIGHNDVRRQVMGVEARRADGRELAAMRALVETAMRDGAVGVSTGLICVPGTWADTAEVVALAEYVRSRRVLTLEEAVRRMTSLPARTFDLRDRGVIREGAAADLVLLEPERVRDTATMAAPHGYSEGFALVVVNGAVVVADDTLTGAPPGRVLRHRR